MNNISKYLLLIALTLFITIPAVNAEGGKGLKEQFEELFNKVSVIEEKVNAMWMEYPKLFEKFSNGISNVYSKLQHHQEWTYNSLKKVEKENDQLTKDVELLKQLVSDQQQKIDQLERMILMPLDIKITLGTTTLPVGDIKIIARGERGVFEGFTDFDGKLTLDVPMGIYEVTAYSNDYIFFKNGDNIKTIYVGSNESLVELIGWQTPLSKEAQDIDGG